MAVLLSICCAGTAQADFQCNASILGVLAYYDGSVNVLHSGRGDWTIICKLTGSYTNSATVGPETCAIWYATLLRAKKNNQVIQFYFGGTGSCATMGIYGNAPVPIYAGELN